MERYETRRSVAKGGFRALADPLLHRPFRNVDRVAGGCAFGAVKVYLAQRAIGIVCASAMVGETTAEAVDVVLDLIDPDERSVSDRAAEVRCEVKRRERR